MNFSVDPCEDFFAFACDNYIATHPPTESLAEASVFTDVEARVRAQIDAMLQLTNYDYNTEDAEVKVKQAYKQCLDNRLVGPVDVTPLLSFMKEVLPGGWPMVDANWDASKFDLYTTLLNLAFYGTYPFFLIEVDPDYLKPTKNILNLAQTTTFASKDVLLSEIGLATSSAYAGLIIQTSQLLLGQIAVDRPVFDITNDALSIVDLETNITLAGLDQLQQRNTELYANETTLGAFQNATLTRSVFFRNLTPFIKDLFTLANVSTPISNSTPVVATTAEVFAGLDEIVSALELSGDDGKRQMANYIGWQVISANIQYLTKDIQEIHQSYLRRLGISKQMPEGGVAEQAKITCIQTLQPAMPLALQVLYVRNFVSPDLQPQVAMMVTDIKAGFAELLRQATWMDNVTISLALRKLDNMLTLVGYSNAVVNNKSAVDLEYNQIMIGPTFFDTIQTVNKYLVLKNLRSIDRINDRSNPFLDRYPIDITQVNAYNDPITNVIDILAGILNPPFYDPQVPQYINYAATGCTIGHEITHGFDDQGALFDADGVLRVWWTNATTQAFMQRAQGFVDQYATFCVPEGCLNGQLTLGENIADNGGIKASYKGYFEIFRKRPSVAPKVLLPGFTDFSEEQMFFLAAGYTWCGSYRTDAQLLRLFNNVHSPPKYRVNGPMSNLPEFADAYNCPLGSNMNPTKKISVW